MNKIIVGILLIAVVVGGGIYFFSRPSYVPSVNNPGQTNNESDKNITIANFSFSPDVLNINKGDRVVWTNQDSAPHNISGNGLESSVFNKGQSFSFTFSEAGTYDYICTLHPYMKGKIIVK